MGGRIVPTGLVVLGAMLVNGAARGEARPADRLTTTAGSTTLLRPVGGKQSITSSRVGVDLYGDHATITQDVTAAGAGAEYEVLAPISEPDQSPWPGHVAAGDFPSFVVLAPGGRALDVKKSRDTAPVGRLVGQVADDAWTFTVDRSRTAVGRTLISARENAQLRVVWTVPYLGDTYHGIKPLDCSCGDPWNFSLQMIGVVIDPAGAARTELRVWNHTGADVVLSQAGKAADRDAGRTLGPGGRWEEKMKGGGGTSGVIDDWPGDKLPIGGTLRRAPFSLTFVERPSKPASDYPRTRLSLTCHSPQEDEGAVETTEAESARREKRLAKDRAAFRWEAVCRLGDEKSARTPAHKPAPKFLRLDGSDASWARKEWFVRGVARELWGPTWDGVLPSPRDPTSDATVWPRALQAWPLLQDGLIRRPFGKHLVVQASTTLPSKDDAYRATNLVDANPLSAWCEGDASDGAGARIQLAFPEPTAVAGLAILPGYVKADWLYEANAAPKRVRVIAETRAGKREAVHDLALPDSAELFAEGRNALILPVDADGVVMLTLVVEQARPGKYTKDLCIGELIPLPR